MLRPNRKSTGHRHIRHIRQAHVGCLAIEHTPPMADAPARSAHSARSALRARLFGPASPARQAAAADALRLIEERHGLPVRFDPAGVAYLEFATLEAAEAAVNCQARTFDDGGTLVGSESDSLVRAFDMVRINTRLWHIIAYVGEGCLAYDAPTDVWRFAAKLALASHAAVAKRAEVRTWLDQYALTTDAWRRYQARATCAICQKNKVNADCACAKLCLACSQWIHRPADAACTGACTPSEGRDEGHGESHNEGRDEGEREGREGEGHGKGQHEVPKA